MKVICPKLCLGISRVHVGLLIYYSSIAHLILISFILQLLPETLGAAVSSTHLSNIGTANQTSSSSVFTAADKRTKSNTVVPGHWLNRGQDYPNCQSLYALEQCKDLPHNQRVFEKDVNAMVELGTLLEQIACTLRKINCPEKEIQSFQVHDIPCRSACLAVVNLCARQTMVSENEPSTRETQLSCPIIRQHTQESSFWYPTSYAYAKERRSPSMYYTQYHPTYSPLLRHQRWLSHWNRPPRETKEYQPGLQSSGSIVRGARRSRPMDSRRTLHHPWRYESPQSPWKEANDNGVSNQTNDLFQTLEVNHNSNYRSYQFAFNVPEISLSDCFFLPSGGCDKWNSYLHGQVRRPVSSESSNAGCPVDLHEACSRMFPKKFTRHTWQAGRYTVAAIIRVSQTVWWFGQNNRFQPFFRFRVLQTLSTDIHPYDDKMILTYSWPSRCICPEEVTVNQQYLMLTHSFKARQTLNITIDTVFLRKVRRYAKKITCWKGGCHRRLGRNRQRRYPTSWYWYTPSVTHNSYQPR